MNDFISWEMVNSYGGLIMICGILTQLLKYLPVIERIPVQLLTYIISFVLLTVSQLALGIFTVQLFGLNFVNAAIASLAANGAYTAITKVIKVQEERIERETVVEVDKPAEETNAEVAAEDESQELPVESEI